MRSKRVLVLALWTLAAGWLLAPAAEAVPQYCWHGCTSSSSCSAICWDTELNQSTTCGAWGVCDRTSCTCTQYQFGSGGADTLNGTSYNDCLYGDDGADTLYGHAGGDKLFGEGGNDTLYGGSGEDCLIGGSGSDQLDGGTGVDTCREGETYISC